MSSRQTPTRGDLILLGMSAICIVAVAVSSTLLVDVIFGLPLAVYLPGAALISAFSPQRRHARVVERQVWIVSASFGLTVLGGFVLNLVGGLTRPSWLVWVGAVVVICTTIKVVVVRGPSRSDSNPVVSQVDDYEVLNSYISAIDGPANQADRSGPIKVSLRQAVLLIAAGALCVAALALSVHTDELSTRESFVQAWVLPRPTDDVSSTSVQLGLRNHLGGRRTFIVDVTVGKGPTKIFSVPLADGASWTQVITRSPGERVESIVFSSSRPRIVLARVYLATPVS